MKREIWGCQIYLSRTYLSFCRNNYKLSLNTQTNSTKVFAELFTKSDKSKTNKLLNQSISAEAVGGEVEDCAAQEDEYYEREPQGVVAQGAYERVEHCVEDGGGY